ncbi:MAG TPA: cation:proton antiporter, partial [Hydrogenophaga sp.]
MSGTATQTLGPIVTLLGAAVVAVPLFRRLGLGSVLAYFAAGLLVGPSGVRLFTDPQAILHVSELGVVMFLFIIGLEMRPQRLWSMRRDIFGLGLSQVLVCTALLTGAGQLLQLPLTVAFVGAAGFVLSSTAVVAQVINERGETHTMAGQQAISILLL